jgi:hypothetical protein
MDLWRRPKDLASTAGSRLPCTTARFPARAEDPSVAPKTSCTIGFREALPQEDKPGVGVGTRFGKIPSAASLSAVPGSGRRGRAAGGLVDCVKLTSAGALGQSFGSGMDSAVPPDRLSRGLSPAAIRRVTRTEPGTGVRAGGLCEVVAATSVAPVRMPRHPARAPDADRIEEIRWMACIPSITPAAGRGGPSQRSIPWS